MLLQKVSAFLQQLMQDRSLSWAWADWGSLYGYVKPGQSCELQWDHLSTSTAELTYEDFTNISRNVKWDLFFFFFFFLLCLSSLSEGWLAHLQFPPRFQPSWMSKMQVTSGWVPLKPYTSAIPSFSWEQKWKCQNIKNMAYIRVVHKLKEGVKLTNFNKLWRKTTYLQNDQKQENVKLHKTCWPNDTSSLSLLSKYLDSSGPHLNVISAFEASINSL